MFTGTFIADYARCLVVFSDDERLQVIEAWAICRMSENFENLHSILISLQITLYKSVNLFMHGITSMNKVLF